MECGLQEHVSMLYAMIVYCASCYWSHHQV